MAQRNEYALRSTPMLTAECWCRCSLVRVSSADVAAGRTNSCGRSLCTALHYTSALTGSGEPCGCAERQTPTNSRKV